MEAILSFLSRVGDFLGVVLICGGIALIPSFAIQAYPDVKNIADRLHIGTQGKFLVTLTFITLLIFIGIGKIKIIYW